MKSAPASNRILYIGIGGKKRHGKDTFADYVKDSILNQQRCVSVIRRGFADAIREEVAVFLCRELAGSPKWPRNPVTRLQTIMRSLNSQEECAKEPFRLLLQWWGVEFRRREFGERYWINALEGFAETWLQIVPNEEKLVILIPDLRLPNEIEFIRAHDGVLIKVERPDRESADAHITETALETFTDWDSHILNDKNLEHLKDQACFFVNSRLRDRL